MKLLSDEKEIIQIYRDRGIQRKGLLFIVVVLKCVTRGSKFKILCIEHGIQGGCDLVERLTANPRSGLAQS